jgi:hypothetical protein
MKLQSTTTIATTTTALFAIAFLAMPMPKASAEDWCRTNEHFLRGCGFVSKEQCQASTAGRAGYCDVNPFPAKSNANAGAMHVESHAEMMACQSMHMDCVVGGSVAGAYAYVPKRAAVHKTKHASAE